MNPRRRRHQRNRKQARLEEQQIEAKFTSTDTRVRAWVKKVLVEAGRPKTRPEQAAAILAAVRHETRWHPPSGPTYASDK